MTGHFVNAKAYTKRWLFPTPDHGTVFVEETRHLVHLALTELLKSARRRDVLALRGQVKWDGDLAELRRLRR